MIDLNMSMYLYKKLHSIYFSGLSVQLSEYEIAIISQALVISSIKKNHYFFVFVFKSLLHDEFDLEKTLLISNSFYRKFTPLPPNRYIIRNSRFISIKNEYNNSFQCHQMNQYQEKNNLTCWSIDMINLIQLIFQKCFLNVFDSQKRIVIFEFSIYENPKYEIEIDLLTYLKSCELFQYEKGQFIININIDTGSYFDEIIKNKFIGNKVIFDFGDFVNRNMFYSCTLTDKDINDLSQNCDLYFKLGQVQYLYKEFKFNQISNEYKLYFHDKYLHILLLKYMKDGFEKTLFHYREFFINYIDLFFRLTKPDFSSKKIQKLFYNSSFKECQIENIVQLSNIDQTNQDAKGFFVEGVNELDISVLYQLIKSDNYRILFICHEVKNLKIQKNYPSNIIIYNHVILIEKFQFSDYNHTKINSNFYSSHQPKNVSTNNIDQIQSILLRNTLFKLYFNDSLIISSIDTTSKFEYSRIKHSKMIISNCMILMMKLGEYDIKEMEITNCIFEKNCVGMLNYYATNFHFILPKIADCLIYKPKFSHKINIAGNLNHLDIYAGEGDLEVYSEFANNIRLRNHIGKFSLNGTFCIRNQFEVSDINMSSAFFTTNMKNDFGFKNLEIHKSIEIDLKNGSYIFYRCFFADNVKLLFFSEQKQIKLDLLKQYGFRSNQESCFIFFLQIMKGHISL